MSVLFHYHFLLNMLIQVMTRKNNQIKQDSEYRADENMNKRVPSIDSSVMTRKSLKGFVPWVSGTQLWPFYWIFDSFLGVYWENKLRNFDLKFRPQTAIMTLRILWKFQPTRMFVCGDIKFRKNRRLPQTDQKNRVYLKTQYLSKGTFLSAETFKIF